MVERGDFDFGAVGKGVVSVDGVFVGLNWDFIYFHWVDDGVDVV